MLEYLLLDLISRFGGTNMSGQLLATLLGPKATTGCVGVNTKTHWSLHTVCTKEELNASGYLTWGQR